MSRIILFDIDHTLLNTTEMAENLDKMIKEESGLSSEVVTNYIDSYSKTLPHITYFDFIKCVETMHLENQVQQMIIDRYSNDISLYPKYDGVDEILNTLKQRGFELGIYSEGTPRFQETKLKNLQIDQLINPEMVFISQSKRSEGYINSLPDSIIVDDNVDVCNLLAQNTNLRVIHLNIKDKKFTPESGNELHPAVTSINKLDELLEVL